MSNAFVSYLNTLHSSDANNRGALAEAQAKEPFFAQIQVPHPWAAEICNTLVAENGHSVVLSGHAGDGKSTIAIEVLRKLKGLDASATLQDGLQKMETVDSNGIRVTVVKDLSECTESAREAIFSDLLAGSRYLLISNTGTLLDFFLKRSREVGKSSMEIEDLLLTALDSYERRQMHIGVEFSVYNLAQCDNVGLAIRFLEKMVDSVEWGKCSGCPCCASCPVLRNRNLIAKYRETVLERLRLLYFRAYAYGERLTMRQISAHFAYMITAGLSCDQINSFNMTHSLGPDGKYLFVNRFWGDDGTEVQPAATQLKAVRVFTEQHLNARYSPGIERRFWDVAIHPALFEHVPELHPFAERVLKNSKRMTKKREAAYSRRQWRRLVYFFLADSDCDALMLPVPAFEKFKAAFLDSPMVLKCRKWQTDVSAFKPKMLQSALSSVLQEEFCGIPPVEGASSTKELYVTLRRKSPDIKQSAQLVLRRFNFSENFKIQMSGSTPPEPELVGIGLLAGIRLGLNLPFLDYIVSRKSGLIGRGMSLSYRDRLEKLMAQIVYKLPERSSDGLLILKQLEDGKLSTISVNVTDDGLEVSNE